MRGHSGLRFAGLIVALAMWSGGESLAQRGTAPVTDPNTGLQQIPARQSGQAPLGADDAVRERSVKIEQEQEKARNDDRQKRLVADTQRLLVLATQLKEEVDRTNKDLLSVDVVKKADEIEKLAHSVKEKMKGS
jgi:hypothetical protein